ncbi:MAG: phosphatidylserine decarboxylase [Micavibrio sp.]
MSASLLDTVKKTILVPPHPAGIPFIIGGVIATLVFYTFSEFLGGLALFFTLACLYFFRDPERVTPDKDSLVVAAADGEISSIVENATLPSEFAGMEGLEDKRFTRISTFLSVLDVHVQRLPVSGKIIRKVYSPGKFLNADLDKASEDNERCALLIETDDGHKVCVVQIAGLIARRILTDVREDQDSRTGARYGIIRFGSRVDVYVPEGVSPLVCKGQRAIGGETVLADFDADEPARSGSVIL